SFDRCLKASGMDETLKSGEFTVFAPTDDAYNKMGKDFCDELCKSENKAKLMSVVRNHIAPGNHPAKHLMDMKEVRTEGGMVKVEDKGGKIMLNDSATVTMPDMMASNGVVHGIE